MYTLIAIVEAKPRDTKHVNEILSALVAPSRAESDCIDYALHQDLDQPARFVFYENWTSQQAHEQHCQMPHYRQAQKQLNGLLAAPTIVYRLQQI